MNYTIYARKSQESEERQVQSIDDQLRLDRKLASDQGLVVLPEHEFTESKSAKEPFQREEFARLVSLVEKGRVAGIIAYHPNRLSRNETDAATVIRLLRTGKLQDLRFVSYHFENSPEGIMFLQLALSQSQYESAKLSREVRRGIDSKVQKGWWPGAAPEGYLNDLATHTVVPDPDRLPLIRRAFHELLDGGKSVADVIRAMNDVWGYRCRRRKRVGGGPLSRSAGYKMFANVFYAGMMEIKGEVVPGAHEPAITLDVYYRVQEIIRKRPQVRSHDFTYGGIIRCGRCGRSVVGERQRGRHGRGDWVYYRCGYPPCPPPKRSVREEKVEDAVLDELARMRCPRDAVDAADEWVRQHLGDEFAALTEIRQNRVRTADEVERKRKVLLEMRLAGELDPETFRAKDRELREMAARLQAQTAEQRDATECAMNTVRRAFDFAAYAYDTFRLGSAEKKRSIALALGTEYLLEGETLTIKANPILGLIQRPLEPLKSGSESVKDGGFSTAVLHGWEDGTRLEPWNLLVSAEALPEIAWIIPPARPSREKPASDETLPA